uniref:Uncharacterized protein n=1 Tax=Brassica oleracea var. oleracea TaxID=109376 RepID=A0A0D2ZXR1_BRAOL
MYLNGSPDQGVWMGCNGSIEVVGYCDADWAGDRADRNQPQAIAHSLEAT